MRKHLTGKDTQTESERTGSVIQESGSQKQAAVAILIPDEADFKQKLVRRDKVHYILAKETIHQ
jgi:hypothetical protein